MLRAPLKSLAPTLVLALLAASAPLQADDTEIYLTPDSGEAAPKVMFHLEYTSELNATICGSASSREAITSSNCSNLLPLKIFFADHDFEDGVIQQFEMTRAALKRVLAVVGGVDVGLLMPHNDVNAANCDSAECSNGGYIMHRMVPLKRITLSTAKGGAGFAEVNAFDPTSQSDLDAVLAVDDNKQSLFDKLDGLRQPQGHLSHPNQLKEIYFELFRYLTGQEVYNGHNGWNDFGTDNAYNLDDWAPDTGSGKNGEYTCVSGYTCETADGLPDPNGLYEPNTASVSPSYDGDFACMAVSCNSTYFSTSRLRWDPAAEYDTNYISPLQDCSSIYVINVLDGGGSAQNSADDDIGAPLAAGGMNKTVSNNDPGFVEMVQWLYDKDLADGTITGVVDPSGTTELLDFADKQNVTSFFIANQEQQLTDAAAAGGTTALNLSDDPQKVIDTIEDLFNDIVSVSTTFVAASIPVNVFNRSEVLDNAYIALFQANTEDKPSWVGNIKKLKIEVYRECHAGSALDADGNCVDYDPQLRFIDADGDPAISALDGRILGSATTYWTQDGYDLYDSYARYPNTADTEELGKDGRTVFRGGAGQQIPGFLDPNSAAPYAAGDISLTHTEGSGRQVYYLNDSGTVEGLDLDDLTTIWPDMFDPDDIYARAQWSEATDYFTMMTGDSNNLELEYSSTSCDSFFGGTLTAQSPCKLKHKAANVIAYIRGKDPSDYDGNGVKDETRRWLVGDPLHSRPLPINYGARTDDGYSVDNPDVRLIVGSNDGFLRMIRNTKPNNGGESGKEDWAFLPREFIALQKQLMDNELNGVPTHPYGVDGPVTAYIQDGDGTITVGESPGNDLDGDGIDDKVWIFFGVRRGGQSYYAFDITDPDAKPVFKWKISAADADYSEMGYSFSQPVVRQLKWGSNTEAQPVLIIGGGYDEANKDLEQLGTDDIMGNAIYVINANTGALIWKASGEDSTADVYDTNMKDGIPARMSAVDGDGDGLVDHAYVGDTGGNLWRVDLNDFDADTDNDVSQWTVTKLMQVGRHDTADLANDRRFFHAADVVPARDTTGRYFAVVIGSGNRAHPLQLDTEDYLFMYKDRCVATAIADCGDYPGTVGFSDLFDATDNCLQEADVDCDSTSTDDDTTDGVTDVDRLGVGWKMPLIDQGEKNLSPPLTVRGVVYFGTYLPAASSANDGIDTDGDGVNDGTCAPQEGGGYQYAVALGDASAVINFDTTNTVAATGEELQIEDRRRDLLSGGIPAENVYVSFRDEDTGLEYHGVLSPDLKPGADLGSQYWRSYWMEKNK